MQAFKKWLIFTVKRFDWIVVFSHTYKTTRASSLRFMPARFLLLATLMLVVSGCIAGSWTTANIYGGTATDIPVGVAVRDFGPTGDVVFVVERRDGPDGPMSQHFLTLLHSVCSAGGCAPADQILPAGLVGSDQYYNASLALKGTVAPTATLDSAHIVRRTGPTAQCDPDELDLSEEEYLFASAVWDHNEIDANTIGNCQDRQLSYTLQSGSTLYSCWTQDPTAGGRDNQVWCSSRLIAGGVWGAPSLLADGLLVGVDDQDHAWFDFDPVNALRYIVHRNVTANPDIITLRVFEPNTVGDMPEGLVGVSDDRDYPSIARAADGSMHAVWHAPKLVGGHIRYARCPATRDCTQAANWVPPVEIRTATGARHAEIMIATNGRLMIMWMEEVPIPSTYPFYAVKEMIERNGIPAGQAQTSLTPGSANVTEVVAQLWTGGVKAFSYVTVINGGHNWPTPTTVGNPPIAMHFNATEAIVQFWINFAGLPA